MSERENSDAPAAGEVPRDLLEFLAEGLVDAPDKVSVEQFDGEDGTIVLELCVAADDYGKVIGRGGRTARALRTVIGSLAGGRYVRVDLLDVDEVR